MSQLLRKLSPSESNPNTAVAKVGVGTNSGVMRLLQGE